VKSLVEVPCQRTGSNKNFEISLINQLNLSSHINSREDSSLVSKQY
jgi:hypothetical protein